MNKSKERDGKQKKNQNKSFSKLVYCVHRSNISNEIMRA